MLAEAEEAAHTRSLKKNFEPKAGQKPAHRALVDAVKRGTVADVEALLKRGADVNGRDGEGQTVLLYAAARGDLEITSLLIRNGATVNASSKTGATALLYAARSGRRKSCSCCSRMALASISMTNAVLRH